MTDRCLECGDYLKSDVRWVGQLFSFSRYFTGIESFDPTF